MDAPASSSQFKEAGSDGGLANVSERVAAYFAASARRVKGSAADLAPANLWNKNKATLLG